MNVPITLHGWWDRMKDGIVMALQDEVRGDCAVLRQKFSDADRAEISYLGCKDL